MRGEKFRQDETVVKCQNCQREVYDIDINHGRCIFCGSDKGLIITAKDNMKIWNNSDK